MERGWIHAAALNVHVSVPVVSGCGQCRVSGSVNGISCAQDSHVELARVQLAIAADIQVADNDATVVGECQAQVAPTFASAGNTQHRDIAAAQSIVSRDGGRMAVGRNKLDAFDVGRGIVDDRYIVRRLSGGRDPCSKQEKNGNHMAHGGASGWGASDPAAVAWTPA
ncbi:MAG TPA: hypothetical protein VGC19_04875 [Rhodanobacter sp.]